MEHFFWTIEWGVLEALEFLSNYNQQSNLRSDNMKSSERAVDIRILDSLSIGCPGPRQYASKLRLIVPPLEERTKQTTSLHLRDVQRIRCFLQFYYRHTGT